MSISLFICSIISVWVLLFLVISGNVHLFVHNFAIDAYGKLYLGLERKIDVFFKGEYQYTVNPLTNRGYNFTIIEGDKILLSTGTKIFELDLDGTPINQVDAEPYILNKIPSTIQESFRFVDVNQNVYHLKSFFGRYKIVKDTDSGQEVLYQMPLFDFLIKLLLYLTVISFIGTFISAYRDKRRATEKT